MIRRLPAPALRPYVSTYVGFRSAAGPPSVHHGVASAHLAFLLCLDGKIEMLANADPGKPPGTYAAAVGGLHDAPARVASGAAQTGLHLDLTWRGARALLGLPAAELAGDTVDLAALLGPHADRLQEQVAEHDTWPERFAALDRALTALLARGPGEHGIHPDVGYAWDRLADTGGNLRIEELAGEIGWSRRHLGGRFRTETGLAPKQAARVIRFERACARLRTRAGSLADVAATGGYVDQAHLARDFRELAGQSATAWMAERGIVSPAGSPARPG